MPLSPLPSPSPDPAAADSVSLYDINYVAHDGTDACAGSPLDGDVVTSHGYISAVTSDGFYMQQDLTGTLWGGIFVYFPTDSGLSRDELASLTEGDYVEVTAEVEEYYGLTELLAPTVLTVLSSGHTLVPLAVSTGTLGTSCTRTGEQYEGLLVVVTEAQLMSEPNNYGEIEMDDGSGPTQLEDGLLDTDTHMTGLVGGTLTGTVVDSITGVVRFAYGSFEVHPRTEADVVISGTTAAPPSAPYVIPVLPLYNISFVSEDTNACETSHYDGLEVTTHGYVSAVAAVGFYMQQELTGTPFGGMWVYYQAGYREPLDTLAVGDYVEVTSVVEEYYDLTELNTPSSLTVLSSGHTLVPLDIQTGDLGMDNCTRSAEQYEGLLVKVSGVTIMSEPNQYGEIEIDDGSGPTELEDDILNTDLHFTDRVAGDLIGTFVDSITGVVRFAYGSFEIHPRAEDDIVFNATAEPGDIPVLSIYNLSYVSEDTDACETSHYIGQHVTTHGYINALTHDGLFMQQHLTGMPFTGLYVYFPSNRGVLATLAVGDYVEITGEVMEYYGLTELYNPTALTVLSSGHTIVPLAIQTGDLGMDNCTRSSEQYEGLLVKVSSATIMSEPNDYGEIEIDDGSGSTQLEDGILDTDTHISGMVTGDLIGTVIDTLTGVVRFAYGSFEIHPRTEADIVISGGGGGSGACPNGPSLYFSQFQEASSGNKKYFQIYNPTAAAISLGAEYSLAYCANGCAADGVFEYGMTFAADATIAAGGTYTVCNSGLGDTSGCDEVLGYPYVRR